MKKLLLFVLLALGVFFCITTGFFFYSKSPNLNNKSEYNQFINLSYPYKQYKDTVKLITYNLGYLSGMTNNLPVDRKQLLFEENLKKSKVLLGSQGSDFICFQEIDFDSDRSYNVDQLDALADHLQFPAVYKSVNWDKKYVPFPYWPPSQHFGKIISGQAIMSRYPILNTETIVLEKPVNVGLLYNDFYLDRLVQIVDVQIGKHIVKIMSLHLEAFEEETRLSQAKVVRALFEQYSEIMPVILMGDFNSNPVYENTGNLAMNEIMQASNIQMAVSKEAYEMNQDKFYTYSSGAPEVMIDYILFNENYFQCVEYQVLREAGEISDHFPVMGKFLFKEID